MTTEEHDRICFNPPPGNTPGETTPIAALLAALDAGPECEIGLAICALADALEEEGDWESIRHSLPLSSPSYLIDAGRWFVYCLRGRASFELPGPEECRRWLACRLARGLRRIGDRRPRFCIFDVEPPEEAWCWGSGERTDSGFPRYPTRGAALLALAEALAAE